ncbi:hypothetical protein J3F84DRAFT_346159 [Trichoderma pleuroticola]
MFEQWCWLPLQLEKLTLELGYNRGHGYATFSHVISVDYEAKYPFYSQVFAIGFFYIKFKGD